MGELINGRYRLLEAAGAGAMGRVWRAHDDLLDREVAVKEIIFPEGLDARQRTEHSRRAMREARSAARLNHHGIVTVFDVTTRDGSPVIVMEFVHGRPLSEHVGPGTRLSPEEVARIGVAVLDALADAHAAGIVHRDIKPANVLLEGSRVVLTDFGIATLAGDVALTEAGTLIGTLAYMAPEQARGLPLTPAADLWSVGATLYAAVEGRAPYEGVYHVAVLAALLQGGPPPPQHAGPKLSAILRGLMHQNPDRRTSGAEAAAALAKLARVAPPRVRPAVPAAAGQPAPRRSSTMAGFPAGVRHSRRQAVLAGSLAILASVALTGATLLFTQSEEPAAPSGRAARVGQELLWDDRVTFDAGSAVNAVVFSPDGGEVATADDGGELIRWDPSTGRVADSLQLSEWRLTSLAYNPDGKSIVAASDFSTLHVFQIAKGMQAPRDEENTLTALAFSPSGEVLVGGDEAGSIRPMFAPDLSTRQSYWRHSGMVTSLSISADGRWLASGGIDQSARVYGTEKYEEIATFGGHPGAVYSVALSADGSLLATTGIDALIRIWDVKGHRKLVEFDTTSAYVRAVTFRPGGRQVAAGTADGRVVLWDVDADTGTIITGAHPGPVTALSFSADGRTLAVASRTSVRIWRAP
ncbi:WD40 repeat domain-containing serine/threonine protein kinase [Nonomuraea sp. NPDC050663]|uniref:WD40 repeat domain-containing serine/threonine protein kinase n=1 Tax=Nonomuraea sp. NPDC050663 TaxID=3364370 RepID=UPI00379B81DC